MQQCALVLQFIMKMLNVNQSC